MKVSCQFHWDGKKYMTFQSQVYTGRSFPFYEQETQSMLHCIFRPAYCSTLTNQILTSPSNDHILSIGDKYRLFFNQAKNSVWCPCPHKVLHNFTFLLHTWAEQQAQQRMYPSPSVIQLYSGMYSSQFTSTMVPIIQECLQYPASAVSIK